MKTIKDKINGISGILLLVSIGIAILTYAIGITNILQISLYGMFPLFLIWFGTRKNGCGSCNHTYDQLEDT